MRGLDLRCAVIEKANTRNKDLRIIDAFDAVLAAGRLAAHRSVWETPFIEEMREWRPGGHGRDDGLDAVAGCLISEPVRLTRHPVSEAAMAWQDWRPGAGSIAVDDTFQF